MRNIADKAIKVTWPAEAYKSAGDEDQFVIDYYDKKTGGYLIDIAAACPVSGSLSFKLLDTYDWFGILVEPSIVHSENILKCYGDVDGVEFYSGAIHRTMKTVTLSEYNGQGVGCSNIFDQHPHSGISGDRRYEVPAIAINELLEKYNSPTNIDFMNLDIEGAEPEVLEDLDFAKYNIGLLCIENGIIYKDFLEIKGYKICDASGYNLMHGNLFFEKV